MSREYRLTWKREGTRRKSRRFDTLAAAEKHRARLIDSDTTPHWRCDEGHGYYSGPTGYSTDGEAAWVPTCMPPIVEGPTLDSRSVGEWGSEP